MSKEQLLYFQATWALYHGSNNINVWWLYYNEKGLSRVYF